MQVDAATADAVPAMSLGAKDGGQAGGLGVVCRVGLGCVGTQSRAVGRGMALVCPSCPLSTRRSACPARSAPRPAPYGDFGLNTAISADERTATAGETLGNTVYSDDLGGAGG